MTDSSDDSAKKALPIPQPAVSRRLFLGGTAASVAAAPAALAGGVAAEASIALSTAKKALALQSLFSSHHPHVREWIPNMLKGRTKSDGSVVLPSLDDIAYGFFHVRGSLGPIGDASLDHLARFFRDGDVMAVKSFRQIPALCELLSQLPKDFRLDDFSNPEITKLAFEWLDLDAEQLNRLTEALAHKVKPLADISGGSATASDLMSLMKSRIKEAIHRLPSNEEIASLGGSPSWQYDEYFKEAIRAFDDPALTSESAPVLADRSSQWRLLADQRNAEGIERYKQEKKARELADQQRQAEQEAEYERGREARERFEQMRKQQQVKQRCEALKENGISCAITPNPDPVSEDLAVKEYLLSGGITRLHVERLRQSLYADETGKADMRLMAKHSPAKIKQIGQQTLLITTDPALSKHLDAACEKGSIQFPAIERDFAEAGRA